MKCYCWVFILLIFLLACSHPHQNTIDNLKNLKIINEEHLPFSRNYKLIGFKDTLEYFLLLNCKGTDLSGNICVPQKKLFYEINGIIDVTGSFSALVLDKNRHFVDTLKGYFQDENLKCAFASNYENVLLNHVVYKNFIPINLYSIKLSGESASYRFGKPKPTLFIHHTLFLAKDSSLSNLNAMIKEKFFSKVIGNEIDKFMTDEVVSYMENFESKIANLKSKANIDSLSSVWIKNMEVVYNQDSIISFYYQQHKKENFQSQFTFQTYVYDTKKQRFLTLKDMPIQWNDEAKHFLLYPNFIRIWKNDIDFQDIML